MSSVKSTFRCIFCGKSHMRFVEKCPETGEPLLKVHKFEGIFLGHRYRLGSIIGEGGMGVVYEGVHEKLGKKVAVKFLKTDIKYSQETLSRFENEAKVAASLGHKNIVEIFDMGEYQSIPYFVMEFLEGEPLDELIDRKATLTVQESVDITIQILEALNAVHAKGIIHRDLKPENIVLTEQVGGGRIVKILDFGICRLQTDAVNAMRVTKTGAIFGTPYYMSPEQAEGRKDIDNRADIYSVGTILYKMLTGRTPFVGENYNAIIMAITRDEPPEPRKWNLEIPRDLDAIIMRAIARNRGDRFLDANEFIEKLEPFSSIAIRRERRISTAGDHPELEESHEPIPSDIWMEEGVEKTDLQPCKREKDESMMPTLEMDKTGEGEISASPPIPPSLPQKETAKAPPHSTPARRTFSWDSTASRIKNIFTNREVLWLLPAGMATAFIALVFIVGAIVTIANVKNIAHRVEKRKKSHRSSLAGIKAAEAGQKSKAQQWKKTQPINSEVEESYIEVAEKPTMFTLNLKGIPSEAVVKVDGKVIETLPAIVEKRQKPYHIEVTAEGYLPFINDVKITGNTVIQVNMTEKKRRSKKKGFRGVNYTSPPIDTMYPKDPRGRKRRKKK